MLADVRITVHEKDRIEVEIKSNLCIDCLIPLCVSTLDKVLDTCEEEKPIPVFDLT